MNPRASSSMKYTFASPSPQRFSLPSNIIYYILKYPSSSKGYEKLQKTCKYFYSRNPLIITDFLRHCNFNPRILGNCYSNNKYFKFESIADVPCKIWIIHKLYITNAGKNEVNVSNLFQSIFKLDVRELSIQKQNLSFDELLFFASSPKVDNLWFDNVNIKYSDRSMVPIEKILELFPKLNKVTYFVDDGLPITHETVKALIKNPNFVNLKYMKLNLIPETFDLKSFYQLVKQQKATDFWLYFCEDISQNYKTQLQIFAENVVNLTKSDETYFPPYITISLINPKTYESLLNLREVYKFRHPQERVCA